VIDGRQLQSGDKYTVTIGMRLYSGEKDMIFKKAVNLRDKLEVEGQDFKVVGKMAKVGNPEDDSQIYIPLDTLIDLYGGEKEYGMIYAQVSDASQAEQIAEDIKKDLRRSRDVEEGQEDFSVQTTTQFLEAFSTILNIVQAVLIGLAAISITVGGVGIMNTMYTSVLERTKEIGVMKAIGARKRDMTTIFLVEAGMLGLLGGIVGTAVGIFLSKIVEFVAFSAGYSILKIEFSPWIIIGSILFSFAVGAISGVLPALRAAKLSPVEALRYE
jgi:putative ABC transport system permease protein